MFNLNLFPTKNIIEKLLKQRRLTIGGLYGSITTILVCELAEYLRSVVFILSDEEVERQQRETKKIIPDTTLIDERNPFYAPSKIILITKDFLSKSICTKENVELIKNQKINIEELLVRLSATGYTREDIVEEENEFALRGGIMDILEKGNAPVRIEFYGDRIFSLRKFNTQTQRSVETIEDISIKLTNSKAAPRPLIELISDDTAIVSMHDIDLKFPTILLTSIGEIQYSFVPARKYFGDLKTLLQDINTSAFSFKFLLAPSLGTKLKSILGEIDVCHIPIEQGFIDQNNKVIYLTETEIFGEIKRSKRKYKGPFVDDLMGLKDGDYVVHSDYGIGQFKGLTLIDFESRKIECLRIDYANADKVYLPIERLNLLERYIAIGDRPPRLSKLGSEIWLRTKKRVKRATERLALDLLKLYARRLQDKGIAFSSDTFEMKELEATFPFEETEDQMKAIIDVKKDMESTRSTERLICGDVGYGKTEIALRAAFKAALDGKQTMLLCPTTLLAFQHYNTFTKRLEPFPVKVEMISRFRKKTELRGILRGVESGKTDIVIGMHRLLQPDVQFKDLGLLIIDEEQRFGVAQKERIKSLKPGIDVIYLSATPIPRTLYMALTGLKDISNIYTPPAGRKDIITKIIYFDEEEIKNIINYEIQRHGQIFFIHNRIQTIETAKLRLSKILPELKICLLHGRMKEETTAKRMIEFLQRKYDLLLSTAIVESGLDMPQVNTIIVDSAHKFGLADLHQLRGRVGRADVQGYSYFIVPSHMRVTDEANKRLGAIISYTSLGSGFRLALRDMEIRGVGNLLGKEQSGHLNSIGYHHYIKLLSASVSELKGRNILAEPILDLRLDAYLPSDYVPSAYERIALYKRLLDVESRFELESIRDEISDRFGRYPEAVENLFLLSQIRLKAKELGATEVIRKDREFLFYKEGEIIHRTD